MDLNKDDFDDLESFYASQALENDDGVDDTIIKKRYRKLPENLQKALNIARQNFIDGENYDKILETCTEIVRLEPKHHEAFELMASIFEMKGDIDKQISALIVAAHCGSQDIAKRGKWDKIVELCRSTGDDRELECMKYAIMCDKNDHDRIDELYERYRELNQPNKADSLLVFKLKWTKDADAALKFANSLVDHFSSCPSATTAKRFIQIQRFMCEVGWADMELTFRMSEILSDDRVRRYEDAIAVIDILKVPTSSLPPQLLAILVTSNIALDIRSENRINSSRAIYYLKAFVDSTSGHEEDYADLFYILSKDLYYTERFQNAETLLSKIINRYQSLIDQGEEVDTLRYSLIIGMLGHSRFKLLPHISDPITLETTKQMAIENIRTASRLNPAYDDTSIILRLYLPENPSAVINAIENSEITVDDNYILAVALAYLLLGDEPNFLRTILIELEKAAEFYEKFYSSPKIEESEDQPLFYNTIRYAGPEATFLLVMLAVESLWHLSKETYKLGLDVVSTQKATQRYLFVASKLMSAFTRSRIFETSQKYTSTATELPSHITELVPKDFFRSRTLAGRDYSMTAKAYSRFMEISSDNRVFMFKYINLAFACNAEDYITAREIIKNLVSKRSYNNNLWSAYFEASLKSGSSQNDTKLLDRHLNASPDSVPLHLSKAGHTYSRTGWAYALAPYQTIALMGNDPLPPLMTALTYVGLSRHRVLGNTAQQVLQTMCWLNQYAYCQGLWCPEVSYNYGRLFHSYCMNCLAIVFYKNVLEGKDGRTARPVIALLSGTKYSSYGVAMPPPSFNGLDVSEEHQWEISKGYDLKKEAAHNLCIILEDSGNLDAVRDIRAQYLTF